MTAPPFSIPSLDPKDWDESPTVMDGTPRPDAEYDFDPLADDDFTLDRSVDFDPFQEADE